MQLIVLTFDGPIRCEPYRVRGLSLGIAFSTKRDDRGADGQDHGRLTILLAMSNAGPHAAFLATDLAPTAASSSGSHNSSLSAVQTSLFPEN
jgi:hypothetical protein